MATLDVATTAEVTLTESAAEQIIGLLEREGKLDAALRVFVSGGGCSGLNYGMAIDDSIEEGDVVFTSHGVKVVVDVRGANVDYVEDVMGGGFKIDNPNATSSCGCGSSFGTEDGPASSGGGCGSGCGCH